MAASSAAKGAATGAVDVVVEEVADNLEELAQATRRINTRSIAFVGGGFLVGAAVGFYFGRRWNREKIKAEAFAASEKEVEKIREVYQQKTVAAEPKPDIEDIMEQRGYSTKEVETEERPTRPPVVVAPVIIAPSPVSAPPVVTYEGGKDKDLNWNYPEELANRDDQRPYIIHQDEYKQGESGYDQTTYTYYAEDGVMIEEGSTDPMTNIDMTVGLDNLSRFGHGADDIDVMFIRNDQLELEMEVCRHPGSYEEEVVGLDGNDPDSA